MVKVNRLKKHKKIEFIVSFPAYSLKTLLILITDLFTWRGIIVKRISALLCCFVFIFVSAFVPFCSDTVNAEPEEMQTEDSAIEISAPSAVLMEVSTGKIIYEKDKDTPRPPASVTKIMTMLLIFDALSDGRIRLDDEVTVSEHAASMGGSQVYLEPGEIQTVDTMLKCIAVASANDACVAMAEHICGSEEEFVKQMNERASELGMKNTKFINCNGLDAEGHTASARDIAVMSRELIGKYPQIHDYSMIWMDTIIHSTSKGESEFGLSNTNKLVRQYEYATGLKTGSTGDAGFCVSATAEKNGIKLIAVIMAAESSKDRFSDAVKLLNYGFGKCQLYSDDSSDGIEEVPVDKGVEKAVKVERKESFSYLDISGINLSGVDRSVEINHNITAPVNKGDVVGHVIYSLNGSEIGRTEIVAAEDVKKASYADYLSDTVLQILL